jgi:signal transduction histidine kinase
VICDEGQLRQALLNLLRNSREALVHGGTIRVETRPLVTQVEIVVADTGPGIPPGKLARVFDPFFSTKERGTGLGLALTQQIIHEHGGDIRCESELGRGTRFILRLKRAPEDFAIPSKEREGPQPLSS